MLNEVRHYYLKYWAESSGPFAPEVRFDRDSIFETDAMDALVGGIGGRTEWTAPYYHHQHGKIERPWRTIRDSATSMMADMSVPSRLWATAISTAFWLKNRRAVTAAGNSDGRQTPLSVLTKGNVDSHIDKARVYGCKVFVKVPDGTRKKLDSKAWTGIFVGYPGSAPGWMVLNPTTGRVTVSVHVRFLENESGFAPDPHTDSSIILEAEEEQPTVEMDLDEQQEHPAQTAISDQHSRPIRERRPPARYQAMMACGSICLDRDPSDPQPDYASYPPDPIGESNMQQTVALLSAAGIPTPRNFKEAMSPEFRDLWKPAIHKEYEGLMANRTWELVDCPPGATILPNQWVFVAKAAPDGTLDKAKARAVVCGNYQKDGDTCKETYAPVIRISSLRVFFTIVAAMQLHLRQLDAVAAYLNASIPADEYLYMRQLQGFDDGSGRVCRLLKCLYGLRQSGRYWCKLLAMWLISVGWIQCKADPCIFILRQGEIYAAMGVYVDDMELAGNDDTWLDSFETDLRNRFVVKRQHDPWVIGMSVSYDRPNRRITLTQTAYIKEILERFGMLDCKKSDVPMVADFCKQPLTSVSESPLLDADGRSQYVRLMGCLLYVSTCTRPDITTALSILGSVQKEPRVMHMTALKKVLRYLKGTMHRGITLGADSTDNLRLVGYADADFAADLIQRRSRGGYLFRLGDHGACSYKSALMPTATQETGGGIAQSTVDAETVSLAQAIKDGIHLKMLVSEILGSPVQPLIMMEDNQGAISYATNAVISDRTKHIDVKWHFVKDHVEAGTVRVNYIATDLNTADMMTKPLPRPALEKHARFAMGW
eukprot:jgi/Tetstr1/425621/TSEL_016041.t1